MRGPEPLSWPQPQPRHRTSLDSVNHNLTQPLVCADPVSLPRGMLRPGRVVPCLRPRTEPERGSLPQTRLHRLKKVRGKWSDGTWWTRLSNGFTPHKKWAWTPWPSCVLFHLDCEFTSFRTHAWGCRSHTVELHLVPSDPDLSSSPFPAWGLLRSFDRKVRGVPCWGACRAHEVGPPGGLCCLCRLPLKGSSKELIPLCTDMIYEAF